MKVEPVSGDDPREVAQALRAALAGTGPAVGLGSVGAAFADVPAGTAAVVTTSGSTGHPKSVVLSAAALTASANGTAARIGEGSWVLALPAGYVAGLQVIVRSLAQGREPAVLPGRFTPQAFAEASLMLPAGVPRYTSLVPAQLAMLLDAAESDSAVRSALRAYEAVLVGGQAMPATLLERSAAAGARVVRTYGSTETSGGCVYDGRPLDGVTVREVDGELQLGGPTLATGYLGDVERTDAAFPRDDDGTRWYRTGDIGLIEDGVVRVRGRIDNVIVTGGINVSLDRVERIVRGIRGLEGAVVVGVPDERWGEAGVVVAARGEVLRRSEAEQLESARDAVAAELGAHARPRTLVLVDELAALPSGKPDREAIRRAVAGLPR